MNGVLGRGLVQTVVHWSLIHVTPFKSVVAFNSRLRSFEFSVLFEDKSHVTKISLLVNGFANTTTETFVQYAPTRYIYGSAKPSR
jgi:hypothetical protein